MKLFEEIEMRLMVTHLYRKKKADADKSLPFISEEGIHIYDVALEDYKNAIQAEYNKLCPKPSEFPEGYEWYSIDSDGESIFRLTKPELSCSRWINVTSSSFGDDCKIPLGIDWRLCCWSIEDAKRIHGRQN